MAIHRRPAATAAAAISPRTPLTSRMLTLVLIAGVLAGLGTAGWLGLQQLMVWRSLSESRTVADMAEHIGRWASQYGGVHVLTTGSEAAIPGNFLTRAAYPQTARLAELAASSAATAAPTSEREQLAQLQTYHWKNPALVQREVADVIAGAGTLSRYRITARTVLNPQNKPGPFELEALDALQKGPGLQEYWRVEGSELLYGRAMVANASCLRCHDSAEKAPDFLRQNTQFNGGGGFGYVAGQPAGLISVRVPLVSTSTALLKELPLTVWIALGVAAASMLGLLVLALRRR